MKDEKIINSYKIAKERYAEWSVDTDVAVKRMEEFNISLPCWQGDDVGGFEKPDSVLSGGGIQATGNYPGKARSIPELMQDIEKVMSLLPGKQRFNLHASYGDFGSEFVDRNEIEVRHFKKWIDWAKSLGIGLDFNPTCFSHPKADEGYTLSSKNEDIRKFWIEHVKRCREIGAAMAKELKTPCINNIWVPDGSKDVAVDRFSYRALLKKSLDEIFEIEYSKDLLKDSLESKLFGIGLESMTVGSYDFYLPYALKNNKLICFDNGHYHPTEQIGDKISSCLQFFDELMLHITRAVRWDSDHVVILNDDVLLIAQEIIRADALKKVNIGVDFFDASMNRIGAYVIGTRATQQAFLLGLLEPADQLKTYEDNSMNFEKLALLEIMKTMPFGAVWDYYCLINDVPIGTEYITEIQTYEKEVLNKR